MRVSVNWLKDFVEIKEPAEQLCHRLTMAGLEVGDCKKIGEDWVLEIEITSNRPDWLSHIGIAREIAAISGKKLNLPKPYAHKTVEGRGTRDEGRVIINIEDKKDCPLYTAMVVDNISIKNPDPLIAQRLSNIGLRPISPVVDITNYILLEAGQPMHAFDLDKIIAKSFPRLRSGLPSVAGHPLDSARGRQVTKPPVEIIVRRAKPGEKIITIDNIERALDQNILVIADSKGPIAIAGVMGGKDTEVDNSTKNILLESAYFDPITIRKSRQKLGLTTESSYRFERSVHMPTVCLAQERAASLIKEVSSQASFSKIYSSGSILKKKKNISLSLDISSLNKALGVSIPNDKVAKILKQLQFGLRRISNQRLKVSVPDFRSDINIPEDIFEEVARIYGYENIPVSLPKVFLEAQKKPAVDIDKITDIISQTLCAGGFFEVITYSLMSRDKIIAISRDGSIIPITNPLSKEQEALRTNLLSGLLEVAAYNFNHSQDEVHIFEMGRVFKHLNNEIKEGLELGILSYGKKTCDWYRQAALKEKSLVNFFDLKGLVETILSKLGIGPARITFKSLEDVFYARGQAASIWLDGEQIGSMGRAGEKILNNWDIRKQNLFASRIDLEALLGFVDLKKNFRKFSHSPAAQRDLSFIIKEGISVKEIKEAIRNKEVRFLENILLFDEYKGKNISKGCRSLSFSFKFSAENRTLREEEINNSLREIRETLIDKFSASIREN